MGEQIIFLYRILPGRTDRSYGIHVAKLAGIPPQTVQRASELLDTLAVQSESTPVTAQSGASASPSSTDARQLGLFTEYLQHPLVQELGEIDLNTLSPLEAFDLLRNYQERAREEPTG